MKLPARRRRHGPRPPTRDAASIWAGQHDKLQAALNTRRVREVMITNVITVPPEPPIEHAAKLLCTHRIGCLPVLEGEKLVGILTEADLLRAFAELFGARSRRPASRWRCRTGPAGAGSPVTARSTLLSRVRVRPVEFATLRRIVKRPSSALRWRRCPSRYRH